MIKPFSRRPRTTIKVRPDGDPKKRFPTGISSTILAIQNYWLSLADGGDEHLTPLQFCNEGKFAATYERVTQHYRGIRKKARTRTAIARMIHRVVNGNQDIEFFHLRAFAEHVGLPTGLLLIFTQLVSTESRAIQQGQDGKAEAIDLVRRVKSVMELAERQLAAASPETPLFNHFYDEFVDPLKRHMAKAQTLKDWSDTYNS